MLSIGNISSSAAASTYYEADDYYAKDSEEHKGLSGWFGKGAKELGLKGQVEPNEFKAMLEGKLPNGIELGRTEGGKLVHAPGIDLTFSAPKSVSIMALVGGDKRILDAQKQAVTTALDWVEKNAVGTRVMKNGKASIEKVDNIVAAMFVHDTSRNMDPQLHTHCVLSNVAMRGDKEWKSAYFKEIFDNKLLIGQIYRGELAKSLSELGFNVEQTHKDGRFEIKEVPKEMVDIFSSRSKEIKEASKDYEFVNSKTLENAALRTRFSKKETEREALHSKWVEIGKSLGFDVPEVVRSVIEAKNNPIKEESLRPTSGFLASHWEAFNRLISKEQPEKSFSSYKWNERDKTPLNIQAVKYALSNLSERESVFSKHDIARDALSFGHGRIGINDIDKAITKLTKDGFILPSKQGDKDFITTRETLEQEKATLEYMTVGRGKTKAIYHADKADKLLNDTALNTSQKGASKHILTSKDRVVGIQGYAGVGKTYMLGATRALAEKQGYRVIGMAPSASSAETLQKDSGIASDTIHKFLFKYDGVINGRGTEQGRRAMREELNKTILVVDESSLAATKHIYGVLKVASILDTKVVLVGDIKQLGAVEAGKPFAQLQEHKMSVAVMDEIFRQKTKDLKEAVIHSLEGNVYKALDKLKDNITESTDVAKTAAHLWLNHKDRDKTLVLAPSNETRQSINEEIRNNLKDEGIVKSGTEISFVKLDSKSHTQAQNSLAVNYGAGDVVLFNRAYNKLGIDKGAYLKVQSVDSEKQEITLTNDKGKTINWKPSEIGGNVEGGVEVFQEKAIGLAEGDKVVWKRNSKDNGLINSHNAVVSEISAKTISFKTQAGKDLKFRLDDQAIKHIDHAYAVTAYSAQGKTSDNVIAVAESKQKNLTTQPTFYVEISRARYEANLVVDDLKAVAEQLSEATGMRISAMESQGLVYESESPFKKADATLMALEEEHRAGKILNNIVTTDEITPPHLEIDTTPFPVIDEYDHIFEEGLKDIVPDAKDIFKEMIEKHETTLAEMKGNITANAISISTTFNEKNTQADLPAQELEYSEEEQRATLAKFEAMLEGRDVELNDNKTIDDKTNGEKDFDII